MVQTAAWVTSLVFMSLVFVVYAVVAWKSREKSDYEQVKKKWTKARKIYATSLVTVLLVVCIYTLRELPYDLPIYGDDQDPTVVDVEAVQFGWIMSETEFKVGEPIEFDVTSSDVTHGFGIYDEDMTIIAQTQAMPEYTNTVYITFTKPGTYKILCMEYCGLAHHYMVSEITVTE
ncbi:cytochrome c oxidase subunit II [Paucisalibacillus globulus]|uniref:cytochrome c oxidase subunit II n=1 Tax=Paucisalibacillus globulus TaxID=351095 RepID=UPI00042023E7|nr:cytochrome c oxidase subunit II [Paucisalibacillus globulus]